MWKKKPTLVNNDKNIKGMEQKETMASIYTQFIYIRYPSDGIYF